MSVLAVISARGGSKRVPGKNLRLLGGKPLVAWSIESGLGAREVARLVVSSEDPAILDIARQYDERLALERPAALAADESPSIDTVRHALATLEAQGEGPFELLALLQPTTPFGRSEDLDAAVHLAKASGADSVVSVSRVFHLHPAKFKRLEGDRLLPYAEEEAGRMAYQQLSAVYVRNGFCYVSRRHVIETPGNTSVIGTDCRAIVMDEQRSVDINTEMDLKYAEFLLAHQ
jgi:CMP-N-acetylneuraminic acid synthetase